MSFRNVYRNTERVPELARALTRQGAFNPQRRRSQ